MAPRALRTGHQELSTKHQGIEKSGARRQAIPIVILVPHQARDRLRRESTLHWIPAFAGMTVVLVILLDSDSWLLPLCPMLHALCLITDDKQLTLFVRKSFAKSQDILPQIREIVSPLQYGEPPPPAKPLRGLA